MKLKLKDTRKKGFILGIIFLLAGAAIIASGFGMAHFDINYLREETPAKWYRTIHLNDNGLSLGVKLGDAYITCFGSSDY